ncbi:peptide-methionine (S)-S-oxide reductase MsrA [Sansalvadorimonas sp. 2012CJ34-2]|uniref:Peptide methionine sulfoxide reductase MsrA n=1 Tax=Parendozoicomonas callyspongiae TaxID=2942213 RepID=A0ABT0PKF5_9GAMM|nr:peptide-methionine (S)-S-oxide reductase MsrA [Sansalvadorimonas sp. 2012CJ34-2]MCL6271860.1 peptide-methionine (S)-S-oxide reductase MsrA [Sansalvadorimonas sp. 2012CJ34-2]
MAGLTYLIGEDDALAGSSEPMAVTEPHVIFQRSLTSPVPENMEAITLGMGCFWGAERLFWQAEGVWLTMVGYAGGFTVNPSYHQVCTGETGHAEVVRIIFDPEVMSLQQLLTLFWENHDPTQGMRQGNDIGTQYRSVIYTEKESQLSAVKATMELFQQGLAEHGLGKVTTEIKPLQGFYFAETYHQQYLARNPNGYCGLKGTGITCSLS